MLRLLLSFLLLLLIDLGFSADSLMIYKQGLQSYTKSNDKVEALKYIISAYSGQGKLNRDSLRKFSLELLDIIKDEPASELSAWAKSKLLTANYRLPFEDYEPFAAELAEEYRLLGDHLKELNEHYYIASKAQMAGDKRTFDLFEKGLSLVSNYESRLDKSAYCKIRVKFLAGQASAYEYNGFYKKSIDAIVKTIDIAEACQDSLALLQAYRTAGGVIGTAEENMGYDLNELSKDSLLLKNILEKTVTLSEALDIDKIYSLACYNMAYYYYDHGDDKKAQAYLELSFGIDDIGSLAMQRYYNHMLLSDIQRRALDNDESYKNLMKGYESALELNEMRHEFMARLDVVDWMIWSGDLDRASHYLEPIRGDLMDNLELQKQFYEKAYQLAEKQKDYKKAYSEYQNFIVYRDSITRESTAQQLSSILNEYDRSVSEKQIEVLKSDFLNQKLKNQKILGYSGLLLLTFIAIGSFLYFRYKNKILVSRNKNVEIEQRLFRAQMNPHFVFNTLGSIQSFLLDPEKANQAAYFLAKFAKLMRQILMQSQKSFITLQEELDTLNNYLLLQKMRFEDRFDYEIVIDESIDTHDLKVPPMLLQPIVENAIEHGKIYTLKGGQVWITFEQLENRLKAVIRDNGVGLKAANEPTLFKNKD